MTILEQRSSCQYWEAQKGCIFKVTLRGKVYQQPVHSFTFLQAVKIMKLFWFVHKILMCQPFFYTLINCEKKFLYGHGPSLLPYFLILNLVHLEMRLEVTIMSASLGILFIWRWGVRGQKSKFCHHISMGPPWRNRLSDSFSSPGKHDKLYLFFFTLFSNFCWEHL